MSERYMGPESEARDAAIRSVAWHTGRAAAAEAVREWARENWPTVTEPRRVDPAIWNSMAETLAKVAEGEGLGASVRRSTDALLERERAAVDEELPQVGFRGPAYDEPS